MGEREDAEREFERVFGKVQNAPEQDASKSSIHAPTQKLPSDSDVLGIRTDSDRFIFKNPIPECLPMEPPATSAGDSSSPEKGGGTPAQDAMTIALSVNVFANIPKPGEERKPGDLNNITWSEATQLFVKKPSAEASPISNDVSLSIPVPSDHAKQSADIFNFPSPLSQGGKQNEEFTRASGAKGTSHGNAPAPTAKFTRIFHVQDSVTLPPSVSSSQAQNPINPPAVFLDPTIQQDSKNPPQATGPSDFTRIVKGSELRALQEKLAAASANAPTADPNVWPAPASPTSSLPTGMATQIWSASSANTQRSAQTMHPWTPPNPTLSPMPKAPEIPVAEPSKLSQYMPLILVLNLLFLLAILLIVFFAIKK